MNDSILTRLRDLAEFTAQLQPVDHEKLHEVLVMSLIVLGDWREAELLAEPMRKKGDE